MHLLHRPAYGLVVFEIGPQQGLPVVGEQPEAEPGILPGKLLLHPGLLLPQGLRVGIGQGVGGPLGNLLLQLLQCLGQLDTLHQALAAFVNGAVEAGAVLPAASGNGNRADQRPHPEHARAEGGGQQDKHRADFCSGAALQLFHG